MDLCIHVQGSTTSDIVVILALSMEETHLVCVLYLAQRFGLDPILINSFSEGGQDLSHPLIVVLSEDVRGVKHWSLRVGCLYSLNCAEFIPKEDDDPKIVLEVDRQGKDDVAICDVLVYRIFTSYILLRVKGASEISKFIA